MLLIFFSFLYINQTSFRISGLWFSEASQFKSQSQIYPVIFVFCLSLFHRRPPQQVLLMLQILIFFALHPLLQLYRRFNTVFPLDTFWHSCFCDIIPLHGEAPEQLYTQIFHYCRWFILIPYYLVFPTYTSMYNACDIAVSLFVFCFCLQCGSHFPKFLQIFSNANIQC